MASDRQVLELVLVKLEELKQLQLNLETKVDEIHKNTKRMENHINFVESTYDKVQIPFHYLMDKVNLLSFSPFRKSEITENEKKEENEEK